MLQIENRSKMSRKELEEAVRACNTKSTQTGEDITYCDQCSREQYQQRCIDEKVYNQRMLDSLIRKLAIDYDRKIAHDGDVRMDVDTGEVLGHDGDVRIDADSREVLDYYVDY